MAKSMADMLEERGIKRGIEQGIEQGETQAKQEIVLKLLNIRFENIPDEFSQIVTSIHSISNLDLLIEKVVTAEKIEEIDLHNHTD